MALTYRSHVADFALVALGAATPLRAYRERGRGRERERERARARARARARERERAGGC